MRKIVAFVISFFFAFPSIAQENKIEPYSHEDFDESYCVRAMPEPILLSTSPDFPPPTIEWVPHRILKETIQLTPEVIVEVEQSGCAHFGLSFRFFFQGLPATTHSHIEWIKKVGNLLQALKLKSFESTKEEIISEIKKIDHTFTLDQTITIIEGYEHLYFFVKESETNVTSVEIWYDIAL